MARATGVSQPHLHNILKGIRSLPPELADQLIALAGFNLPHLMETNGSLVEPGIHAPIAKMAGNLVEKEILTNISGMDRSGFATFQLLSDAAMEPRFLAGDIVYYQPAALARTQLNAHAAYLVSLNNHILVRYLRMGGKRLYLVSEDNIRDPMRWDYVSLADRHILEIVRGRIVWICRKVETLEAGASEEARGDDRRVG